MLGFGGRVNRTLQEEISMTHPSYVMFGRSSKKRIYPPAIPIHYQVIYYLGIVRKHNKGECFIYNGIGLWLNS